MKNSNAEKLFDIEYMGIADCEELVASYNNQNETEFKYSNIFYVPEDTKESVYPPGYTNEFRTTPGNRWKTDHIWALAYAGFDDKKTLSRQEHLKIPSYTRMLLNLEKDGKISSQT